MSESQSPTPSPIQVLVVEDDPYFQLLFQSALDNAPGIDFLGLAPDGATALSELRESSPEVLLVDLGLPDMSGLEVIRYCAANHARCDIMVITVFGDEDHVLRSIEAGATGYLLKDSMPEDLVAQIHTLHAGGSPISPIIARRLLQRRWTDSANTSVEALSERERAVLQLTAKGYSFPEIARLLDISHHSVMTYVKRSYRKLHVNSKTEAVYEARKMGLLRD